MHTKTNLRKLIDRILASKCEVVKIGADVHARDVVVSLQLDGARPERAVKLDATQLVALVTALIKGGLTVHVCQEAGPCGYVLHRRLVEAGAHSLVVVPTVMTDGRQQKTDGLDAIALVDKLDRYLRGNTKSFTVITVPTPEQEQDRARSRLREQLKHSRHEWEMRGRSLMLNQGHHITGQWWRASRWERLRDELPGWLTVELENIREVLLKLDAQEQARRAELEAAAPEQLPKSIGALTWVMLSREICDWSRFKNRRQVSSFSGLCPGGYQSGGTRRDGHINRHGNPIVRHLLIEMIWRMVRWQPAYPPVRKLIESGATGAVRRKLAVAAARRLAVDLWRLATKQTTPEKLQLVVPAL